MYFPGGPGINAALMDEGRIRSCVSEILDWWSCRMGPFPADVFGA
jgi:hypothetical protein